MQNLLQEYNEHDMQGVFKSLKDEFLLNFTQLIPVRWSFRVYPGSNAISLGM